MTDTLERGRSEPVAAPAPTAPASVPADTAITNEPVNVDQYLTYSLDHDVPFVADYYGIGPMLDYQDLSYKAEVDSIDNYLVQEVKGKRLDNTTEAVKARLKQLERIAGIPAHVPTATRVQKLAAYAQYLQKVNEIDRSFK